MLGKNLVKEVSNGEVSLQIVETSQLDLSNDHTKECMLKASYFNPVDLVCALRDYKGNKFDLSKLYVPSVDNSRHKRLKLAINNLFNVVLSGY